MKDTITLPRLVVEQCMVACEINGWSTVAGTLQAALDAPAPTEDPILDCNIAPRPLQYPLSHYHMAIGGGPLHYTWKDKPHRLVYDLIAAVKYYAQQPLEGDLHIAYMVGYGKGKQDAIKEKS